MKRLQLVLGLMLLGAASLDAQTPEAFKQQALGQLMRHVKEATGGRADMPLVNRLLRERLSR